MVNYYSDFDMLKDFFSNTAKELGVRTSAGANRLTSTSWDLALYVYCNNIFATTFS